MKQLLKPLSLVLALFSLALSLIACTGGNETIDFSSLALREIIPEIPSDKGILYDNSEEELWISLEKVTDSQYNDYLTACIEKGFLVDAKKDSHTYKAYNEDGFFLDMSHYSDGLTIRLRSPMELGAIVWPKESAAGKLLPIPKSSVGKFSYEYDDHFLVYIGNTEKSEYLTYAEDCAEKGFAKDYERGDDYYRAYNGEWYLSLSYEGNKIMKIEIKKLKTDDSAPHTTESSTPPATSGAGLSTEFKNAMDSYEGFIDEYVAFMKKYKADPTDLGILSSYSDYMKRYSEFANDFQQWESRDLSPDELSYYVDVQARVSKKILEIL